MGKGSSSTPSQTPAESLAYKEAQPYLAQSKSGVLSASDQATANLADTNQTAVALQDFSNGGMSSSSSAGASVGTVTKGTSSGGMQAGAGSSVDLNKLSLTQTILQSDLQTGMAYLAISSGQASDLASIQQAESAQLAQSLGQVSSSFASILGQETGPGTDVSFPTQSQIDTGIQDNQIGTTVDYQ